MYEEIITSVQGRIGTITLNRPQLGNALARASYGEIRRAVEAFEQDQAIGAIVITGAGKHFSAGGDIQRFKTLIESGEYLSQEGIAYAGEMTRAIRRCTKPVIAMVNGVATGAGLSLALACDFRIVEEKSKLIMGFIKMGLPGDTGSLYFLPRLIGVEKASLMMMTGDPVSGKEAVEMGLATFLAEEDKLSETTYQFAEKLSRQPAQAIARQKEILFTYFYPGLDQYYEDEKKAMAETSRKGDFTEAVHAFLEKRSPRFNQNLEQTKKNTFTGKQIGGTT